MDPPQPQESTRESLTTKLHKRRMEFYVLSNRVLVGEELLPRAVRVKDQVIQSIDTHDTAKQSGLPIHDHGDLVVMCGLVDSHVHVNEPGRTDWEGFDTATRAAAAGGVTTIVDMPLNSDPVTTTVDALRIKSEAMQGQLQVDVGLLGGVIPGNGAELEGMLDGGVLGFKCFMTHSGLDEFPGVSSEDIASALKILHECNKGGLLMFHAEDDACLHKHAPNGKENEQSYADFLASRPKEAEDLAIESVIEHVTATPFPCHIVHLASANSVPVLKKAQEKGLPITVETTFHYLHFNCEDIPDGATLYKCCPPIRSEANREALWDALKDGVITQVISDHSPCTPNLKNMDTGSFSRAWGGIASLQLGLPIMWTDGKKRGCTIADISRWCAKQTAELVGIGSYKGQLAVGYDADICVWDPDAEFAVAKDNLHFKNKYSPYESNQLKGVVSTTYVRGHKVYENGKFVAEKPVGGWIKRK